MTYETSSIGVAAVCILVTENALLIHFLIPNSLFSKYFQPIALIGVILASIGSGNNNFQEHSVLNNYPRNTNTVFSVSPKEQGEAPVRTVTVAY